MLGSGSGALHNTPLTVQIIFMHSSTVKIRIKWFFGSPPLCGMTEGMDYLTGLMNFGLFFKKSETNAVATR